MDKESPASLSTVHCQLSIAGRVARVTSGPRAGEEWSLDSLTDFGFLLLGDGDFAIARLFRTPDGTPLLADAQEFAGTPETAFERLWHGHFRRNFFLVGMEESQFHATADLRERIFSACLERSIRLSAPAVTGRNLQVGHFEETPDGFRRILPRGDAPTVPSLPVQPAPACRTGPNAASREPFPERLIISDRLSGVTTPWPPLLFLTVWKCFSLLPGAPDMPEAASGCLPRVE